MLEWKIKDSYRVYWIWRAELLRTEEEHFARFDPEDTVHVFVDTEKQYVWRLTFQVDDPAYSQNVWIVQVTTKSPMMWLADMRKYFLHDALRVAMATSVLASPHPEIDMR